MGDIAPKTLLPPGCRFYPSEEQLLFHYLTPKSNLHRSFSNTLDPINDLDLYAYAPFDLPDSACFRFGRGGRRRHWYCYVAGCDRGARRRKAGGGFWRRRGREKDVAGARKGAVGFRKRFDFYLGDSEKNAVRTDWVMYEYALVDRHESIYLRREREKYVVGAGKGAVGFRKKFDFYLRDSEKNAVRTNWVMYEYALVERHEVSFVLCRILVKLTRRCKGSDHVLSSCGEDSFATVRDIGIQHDGNITSSFRETVVQNDDSVDKKEKALQVKFGLASEINDQITARDIAVAGVELLPHEPAIVYEQTRDSGASFLLDNLIVRQLVSILEEDYIELDDLTTPLSGIDFT